MMLNSFQTGVFDDDATRAMNVAFELSCKSLPYPCHSDVVRELIAKHIVEAAGTGERNPVKLSEKALRALSVDDMAAPLVSGRVLAASTY